MKPSALQKAPPGVAPTKPSAPPAPKSPPPTPAELADRAAERSLLRLGLSNRVMMAFHGVLFVVLMCTLGAVGPSNTLQTRIATQKLHVLSSAGEVAMRESLEFAAGSSSDVLKDADCYLYYGAAGPAPPSAPTRSVLLLQLLLRAYFYGTPAEGLVPLSGVIDTDTRSGLTTFLSEEQSRGTANSFDTAPDAGPFVAKPTVNTNDLTRPAWRQLLFRIGRDLSSPLSEPLATAQRLALSWHKAGTDGLINASFSPGDIIVEASSDSATHDELIRQRRLLWVGGANSDFPSDRLSWWCEWPQLLSLNLAIDRKDFGSLARRRIHEDCPTAYPFETVKRSTSRTIVRDEGRVVTHDQSSYTVLWVLTAFPLITAGAHGLQAAWAARKRTAEPSYMRMVISRGVNPVRWIEYTLSAGVMTFVIAQMAGVTDLILLWQLILLNALTHLIGGWYHEHINQKVVLPGAQKPYTASSFATRSRATQHWPAFWLASAAQVITWIVIWAYFGRAVHTFDSSLSDRTHFSPANGTAGARAAEIPWFVTAVIVGLFIAYSAFALIPAVYYGALLREQTINFARGSTFVYEMLFQLLSLTAKTYMIAVLCAGIVQRKD